MQLVKCRLLMFSVSFRCMQLLLTKRFITDKACSRINHLKCSGMKVIENDLLKIGFHFMHLTKNDTSFTFNFSLSQNTVLNYVRQYLHCTASSQLQQHSCSILTPVNTDTRTTQYHSHWRWWWWMDGEYRVHKIAESGFPRLSRTLLCAFSRTFQDHLCPLSMSFQNCLIKWISNKLDFHEHLLNPLPHETITLTQDTSPTLQHSTIKSNG